MEDNTKTIIITTDEDGVMQVFAPDGFKVIIHDSRRLDPEGYSIEYFDPTGMEEEINVPEGLGELVDSLTVLTRQLSGLTDKNTVNITQYSDVEAFFNATVEATWRELSPSINQENGTTMFPIDKLNHSAGDITKNIWCVVDKGNGLGDVAVPYSSDVVTRYKPTHVVVCLSQLPNKVIYTDPHFVGLPMDSLDRILGVEREG